MHDKPFNVAIETSDRVGWLTLGQGDEMIESVMVGSDAMSVPLAGQAAVRRSSDLMPTLETLCQKHDVSPSAIGEIYVSVGPGSFTGLRVAVSAAKMMASLLGAKLVAVPTIEVVALQIPTQETSCSKLAVALNFKRQTAWCAMFDRMRESDHHPWQWKMMAEAKVMTLEDLLAQTTEPVELIAPALPAATKLPAHVTLIDPSLGQPHSQHTWQLGRAAAKAGRFVDAYELAPIYARPPEAVELWNQRHGSEG